MTSPFQEIINTFAYEWAFYGERAEKIFPKGAPDAGFEPGENRAEYAYWVIEDGIALYVRAIAATPGYQRYWSVRVRGLMLAFFREGRDITESERGILGKVLGKAAKAHTERAAIFEDAA